MPLVKVSTVYPIMNAINSIVSSGVENLKVKLDKNDQAIKLFIYDKEKDLEIYAKFPDTTDTENNEYFAINPKRFQALIAKFNSMELTTKQNMLHFSSSTKKGKVEIEECEKFKVPVLDETSINLNHLVLRNLSHIKLEPLFKGREMMLFANYSIKTKTLNLCCADNFHVALATITQLDTEYNFDIAIPMRYIEWAKRFADEGKISLAVMEGNTYFFTPYVIIKLPTVSSEGNTNLKNALEHFESLENGKLIEFKLDIDKLKTFFKNAEAIKEEDKGNEIEFTIKEGKLRTKIETKHGVINQIHDVGVDKPAQVKFNCAAISDFLGKLDGNTDFAISGNNLIIRMALDKNNKAVVKYTTIGVE